MAVLLICKIVWAGIKILDMEERVLYVLYVHSSRDDKHWLVLKNVTDSAVF